MINKLVKYFLWLVALIAFLYIGALVYNQLMEEARNTYRIIPSLIFASTFPIVVGFILYLPKFVTGFKQKKQWNVNWAKLIVFGLPLLYISLYPIIFGLGLPLIIPYVTKLIMGTRLMIPTIAGIIFGYVLLDSLLNTERFH